MGQGMGQGTVLCPTFLPPDLPRLSPFGVPCYGFNCVGSGGTGNRPFVPQDCNNTQVPEQINYYRKIQSYEVNRLPYPSNTSNSPLKPYRRSLAFFLPYSFVFLASWAVKYHMASGEMRHTTSLI